MSKKKSKPASKPRAPATAPAQPKKIMAMDLFRAQDAASKIALRAATVDGFDNFISRIGLNNENALSGGTYEFNLITRNRVLLEAAYRGSWIVGSIVDSVAEDMTRAGLDVTTNEADEDLEDLENGMTRLQIWQSICNLVKWGRLYGGAIGVIQIEGQKLDTPLNLDTIAKGQFRGIVVYDRWQLNPVLNDVIDSGPEMGLPAMYQIVNNLNAVEPGAPNVSGQVSVHHSRCIRYTGIDLPFFQAITEMMWGESILERLWDRLISFDNATMSAASLIDRANLRQVGIEGLREIIAAGGEAQKGLEAQFEMMRMMQVNEGLTLLDKEDTYASTAYTFTGLSDMLLQFAQQLSGASGIPLVRLLGQSPAGLSATGDADIRMYYDNINAQQEAKLRNPFEVLLKVMWRSIFGKPAPKDLQFTFTALWQMSETDKATNAKTGAETIIGAYEAGLTNRKTSLQELRAMAGSLGVFSNITDEDIDDAENDEPPMPDADPAAPEPGMDPNAPDPKTDPSKKAVPGLDKKPGLLKRMFGRKGKDEWKSGDPRKNDGKFGSGSGGKSKGTTTKTPHDVEMIPGDIFEPKLSEEEEASARARFRKPDDRPNPSLQTPKEQSEHSHAREKALRERAAKKKA